MQVCGTGRVVYLAVEFVIVLDLQGYAPIAGATADAFTLFERLEGKLEEHTGQLTRAAVELAKMWRMDKYLRRLDVCKGWGGDRFLVCCQRLVYDTGSSDAAPLPFLRQAALIVADKEQSLQITGTGDVLEPHDGIIAIGSGSPYALAAARALVDVPGLDALTIAHKAMTIAADSCVYTNHNFTIMRIDGDGTVKDEAPAPSAADLKQ